MIPIPEREEQAYLESIQEKLREAVARADYGVRQVSAELKGHKEYLYENRLDAADKASMRQTVNQVAATGEAAAARRKRLLRLQDAPYFGRIDFAEGGQDPPTPFYIGVHSFGDGASPAPLIYDWRAPVSSLFYDYELGPASFRAPSGEVTGEIIRKRQYKITGGRLEFVLENGLHIQDDVLQRELSRTADDRMKHIVATIQRDQNAIIRNETAPVMIIQGVAGSGKTSVALHRIAFLLYRYRDTLTAKDVLILSPNRVFADYIAAVLPELGEEKIPEMGMQELATAALGSAYKFQTFFEQTASLLEHPDEAYRERIAFKASFSFLTRLDGYLVHVENRYFTPRNVVLGGHTVPAAYLGERFRAYSRLPLLKRLPQVVQDAKDYLKVRCRYVPGAAEGKQLAEAVKGMLRITRLTDLYKDFYAWLGRPELRRPLRGSVLEYADVFPLVYLKMRLEGVAPYEGVKHLVVDEMQDYTPVQYAVLARLFTGKKTILGDANQAVNPYGATTADDIARVFPRAEIVRLNKSYRSTCEITAFAGRILPNPDLVAVERHGPQPAVRGFETTPAELDAIREMLDAFRASGHKSLGILCKTEGQAAALHGQLQSLGGIRLLTARSTTFAGGILVTTAALAKGLEFDDVIVPFATAGNYQTSLDRSTLYVACTRAMHRLSLTHTGPATAFLSPLD